MNALVVGFGSAGGRHAKILAELGCDVAVVSSCDTGALLRFAHIAEALAAHRPEYVVIASRTVLHYDAIDVLAAAGFTGHVLVEKPLFDRLMPVPNNSFSSFNVAYNLRFHPVIAALRERLHGQQAISAQVYVGQYLPDWRPTRDYRDGYSANKAEGGGALRDLSHELDYLTWMLGDWTDVAAQGGHLSPLEIDSDDVFCLLVKLEGCPVATVQMNYLDRVGRRQVLVNTAEHTYCADLFAGTLTTDGVTELFDYTVEQTWRAEHEAVLEGRAGELCSQRQALDIMRLIEAAERAAAERIWVAR